MKMIFSFIAGSLVGAAIAYKFSEKKFTDRLDSEIHAIKTTYKNKEIQDKVDYSKNKPPINEITKINQIETNEEKASAGYLTNEIEKSVEKKEEYKNYASYYKTEEEYTSDKKEENIPMVKRPYVISPDDFGSMNYEEINLTYFADGVLTEENNSEKLSIKKTIGKGNLKHMGEYANDALYIRDEEKEIDYEILKDERTYSDVYGDELQTDEE